MWYILGVILWIIVAFWPAMLARRKGHSFILFFILSIVFFPLSLILAYVVHDRNQTAQDRADDEAAEKALDREYDES